MPMTVSPQADRLGRLSQLLDRYVHALEEKPWPEGEAERAAIADRDIRTVDIVLRCEERLQAMMAPAKPADGEEQASQRAQDEQTLAALKRRLDQRLGAEKKSGASEEPD